MQERILGKRGLEVSALGLGFMKLNGLEENIGSANTELATDELRDITGALASLTAQTDRYSAHLQQRVDR